MNQMFSLAYQSELNKMQSSTDMRTSTDSLRRSYSIFEWSKAPAQSAYRASRQEDMKKSERSDSELKSIHGYLAKIPFLKEKELTESEYQQICRYLQHYQTNANEMVFDYGDWGETFYIILKGSVKVFVPVNVTTEEEGVDKKSVKINIEGEEGIKGSKEEEDGLTEEGSSVRETNSVAAGLIEVDTLYADSSFGELSLLINSTRSARIICMEDCHFATLKKVHYDLVLAKLEQKLLQEKVNFFLSVPYFGGISRRVIYKIYHYFKPINLQLFETLFTFGEKATELYLIEEGELEVKIRVLQSIEDELKINKRAKGHMENQLDLISNTYHTNNLFHENYRIVKLGIWGKGQLLGEEDAMKRGTYQYQAKCSSPTAKLYSINIQHFLQFMLTIPWFKAYFEASLHYKRENLIQLLQQIQKIDKLNCPKKNDIKSVLNQGKEINKKKKKKKIKRGVEKHGKLKLNINIKITKTMDNRIQILKPPNIIVKSSFFDDMVGMTNKNGIPYIKDGDRRQALSSRQSNSSISRELHSAGESRRMKSFQGDALLSGQPSIKRMETLLKNSRTMGNQSSFTPMSALSSKGQTPHSMSSKNILKLLPKGTIPNTTNYTAAKKMLNSLGLGGTSIFELYDKTAKGLQKRHTLLDNPNSIPLKLPNAFRLIPRRAISNIPYLFNNFKMEEKKKGDIGGNLGNMKPMVAVHSPNTSELSSNLQSQFEEISKDDKYYYRSCICQAEAKKKKKPSFYIPVEMTTMDTGGKLSAREKISILNNTQKTFEPCFMNQACTRNFRPSTAK